MKFLNHKSSLTSNPAMVKSEATTAVPSQNVSTTDLPAASQDEKEAQREVLDSQSTSSAEPEKTVEPAEKTEDMTAVEEAKALDEPGTDSEIEYPHGLKLAIISVALCLSVFLVALVSSAPTT